MRRRWKRRGLVAVAIALIGSLVVYVVNAVQTPPRITAPPPNAGRTYTAQQVAAALYSVEAIPARLRQRFRVRAALHSTDEFPGSSMVRLDTGDPARRLYAKLADAGHSPKADSRMVTFRCEQVDHQLGAFVLDYCTTE